MTEQHVQTQPQEPGLGGPVDLAGVERYRHIQRLAISLLALIMFASLVTIAVAWPDLPERSAWPGAPTGAGVVVLGFVFAMLALTVDAGNRTEIGLVCLGTLWAIVIGILSTLGCAALLEFWAADLPAILQLIVSLLAGYAAVQSFTLPWAILARRRYKRLLRAAEQRG